MKLIDAAYLIILSNELDDVDFSSFLCVFDSKGYINYFYIISISILNCKYYSIIFDNKEMSSLQSKAKDVLGQGLFTTSNLNISK
jgi:hypothetical protein